MAAVLPRSVLERIQWAEEHIAPFTTNAVAIGITSTIATDFETKTESARAAFQARNNAKNALRDRDNDLRMAMLTLGDASGAIVNTVHAKADLGSDQK